MTEQQKKGWAPLITAMAALITSVGTLVTTFVGQQQDRLEKESLFNYATVQNAELMDRLARVETHIEWLRGHDGDGVMEEMLPEMGADQECMLDLECEPGHTCSGNRCVPEDTEVPISMPDEPKAVTGVGGGAPPDFDKWSEPPAPKPEKAAKKAPKSFGDLQQHIQMEQKAWGAKE